MGVSMGDLVVRDRTYQECEVGGIALPRAPLRPSESPHPNALGIHRLDTESLTDLLLDQSATVITVLRSEKVREQLSALARAIVENEINEIIIIGAGTSGRIAHAISLNHMLYAPKSNAIYDGDPFTTYDPNSNIRTRAILAGGAKALTGAAEGAEDNGRAGLEAVRDLRRNKSTLVLGIACSLATPFVAGALQEAGERGFLTSIVTTNSLQDASTTPIEGVCSSGFRGVISALNPNRFFPVEIEVGPELIAGSTRMKGAEGPYVALRALLQLVSSNELDTSPSSFLMQMNHNWCFELLGDIQNVDLGTVVERASEVRRGGGSIYYVGDCNFGLAGIVDAAEVGPTFGMPLGAFNGYLRGGWHTLMKSGLLGRYRILANREERQDPRSLAYFRDKILPTIGKDDLIINNSVLGAGDPEQHSRLRLNLYQFHSAKAVFAAISTAVAVKMGLVYDGAMVALTPKSAKLWERSVRMVEQLAGVPDKNAEHNLVIAALGAPNLSSEEASRISLSTKLAAARSGIVPLAVLLSRGIPYDHAKAMLLGRSPNYAAILDRELATPNR